MSEPTAPFSRMDADILSILPMLSGSAAKVYMALGAFEADPVAPSQNDVIHFTGASRPSVSEALAFLCTHELARCFAGEDGVLRYRSRKYFHYGAREPVSVRERLLQPPAAVPVSVPPSSGALSAAADVKKIFTSPPIIVIDSSSTPKEREPKNNKSEPPAKKILQSVGIHGKVLQEPFLAEVSAETAHAWADWIRAYDGKSNPQGIAVNALREDADARPYIPPARETHVTKGGYDLDQIQRTCGTMAHKLWAPYNGGCAACGILPKPATGAGHA